MGGSTPKIPVKKRSTFSDDAELRNRFPSRNHLSWSSSYDGQKEQRIFPRL